MITEATQTATLVGAVQQLALARSHAEIQQIVRHAARRLTGADGATFVLKDGTRCWYVDEDAIEPLWKGMRFPLEACISGWAMRNREAARIVDIYADDRIPHDAYRPTFVRSLAMVPIRRLDPVGAIGNYWADHHQPTDHEVELLQALADSTAVALENVRVLEELEQRVADRTAQLEARTRELEEVNRGIQTLYEDLRTVSATQQEAAAATQRLLNEMAHEVRGPLVAGRVLLESLREDYPLLDGQARDDVVSVEECVVESLRVVQEQLDRARNANGAIRVLSETVDLGELLIALRGTFRALRPQGRDVVLRFENDAPDLRPIRTDRHLVAQILRNLISNALKFTDHGRVTVTLRQAEADYVQVEVADTGIGIAPEHVERIFEEFGQVDANQTGRLPGSGLGLPLVVRLIDALDGELQVNSAPGQGSTFTVVLPLV